MICCNTKMKKIGGVCDCFGNEISVNYKCSVCGFEFNDSAKIITTFMNKQLN